jgi:hypothetical protein
VVSHQEAVRDFTESGLRRMVTVMAAILPLAALIQALANLSDYRQPAVAIAVWLAMFAAAAWLVPQMGTGGLARGEAAAAVLIAVAAAAAIGWEYRPHHGSGSVDLAILGTVWLLALVALSYPARVWVPGALVVFAVHAALLIRAAGASPLSLAKLEVAGYILAAVLVVFAALRPTLAMQTSMTTRRAALASRSLAERSAVAAIQDVRRSRLALLEMEALPLLRGVADGTLDPADGDVRERCARHAAVLRHSLTDPDPDRARGAGALVAGALVAGLQPALQVASARGLLVNVQVIGDPGIPAPEVAHAVLATVDAVLSVLPAHQVMLTVLAPGGDVELYLTFSEPLRVSPDVARFGQDVSAAACWHAAVTAEEAGTGCLEISWRKAVP